ncbi:tautomerase family protein [Acidocella sp.]|uniref:tautomerase family protein n=1 Tax=Acidocella sp. TaxID=50710 RepID=UPI003D01584A
MPHIEASFFAHRFDDDTFSARMIEALTEAVCSVIGEEAGRDATVVLHGIDPSRWGYRGKPLAGRVLLHKAGLADTTTDTSD